MSPWSETYFAEFSIFFSHFHREVVLIARFWGLERKNYFNSRLKENLVFEENLKNRVSSEDRCSEWG